MAVNKVAKSDGTVLIDLTADTVTSAEHIMSGFIGHLANGTQVTGTGQGGSSGLEYEEGIWTPSADTAGEKILFANQHGEAPVFIHFADATGTSDTTTNTNMAFVWFDYYKLFRTGLPKTSSAFYYASAFYMYRATSTTVLTHGAVHCIYSSNDSGSGSINYPRFWTDELGFTPNSASTSRYWRANRTYKWYAIWRQT